MRLKLLILGLVSILFFGIFSVVFTNTCEAIGENNEGISIKKKSYKVLEIDKSIPANPVVYFQITITVQNTGSLVSDPITVVLIDEDYATKDDPGIPTRVPRYGEADIVIPPGESRDFVFGAENDWMIIGLGKHEETVRVIPNNDDSIILDEETLVLDSAGQNSNDNSSPGFELVLLVSAIATLIFFSRKRKK